MAHKTEGISNIIFIKETEYQHYVFDFNAIHHLPLNDVTINGLEAAIKKHGIPLKYPYAAFIPIFYTNKKCVFIGVIDKRHLNHTLDKSPSEIIINPL